MFDRSFQRMMQLLESENGLLRRGDIEGAAKLGAQKERLLERLAAMDLPPDRVAALKARAERNHALIDAARQGIVSAQKRIGAIRRGASVNTYSARGDRELIRAPQTTLHKRA